MPSEGQTATGPNGQRAVYSGGQWVVRGSEAATVAPNPFKARTAVADERRKEEDQQFQREQLRLAQEAAARAEASLAAQIANQNKPPEGFVRNPDGTMAFIPGGPADPALKAGKTGPKTDDEKAQVRNEAIDKVKLARSLIDRSKNGWFTTGVGSGVAGYFKGTPAYDVAQDTETLKNAGALTRIMEMAATNGGKNPLTPLSNSDFQALASSLSNLETGQSDTQYQANIQRVIDLYQRAYQGAGGTDLEGDIDPSKRRQPLPALPSPGGGAQGGPGGNGPGSVWQQPYNTPGGPGGAAPMGATTQGMPIDPAMQAELNAYIQQQGRNVTPQGLSQFITSLYGKYGGSGVGPGLDEYANQTANALQRGGQINTNIPPETVPLAEDNGFFGTWLGSDRNRNNVVNNPVGAFAVNMGNAGGLGIPSLLAGDQMSALREANPVSSTLGEVAGGITGSMVTGAALGAAGGSRLIANPAVRSAITNPFTADVAYGGIYGATQADDPVYGALGGAAAGAAGNVIGRGIGKAVPRILGRAPADPLSGGERAVLSAVDRDGVDPVLAALQQGQELGLPTTLADASPVVAALTGSSIRRSPAVAGQARDILARRSQGQLDRLRTGITRDLGPLDNVPERADALIQQARTRAGPLYDEAYATPIPSTPELDSLLNTPFGRQAIGRSRTIAANEGRSPTELGFALDEAGNPVLNPAPNDLVAQHLMARDALDQAQTAYRSGSGSADDIMSARQVLREAEAALDAAPTPGARSSVPTYTTQSLDYAKRGMDDILEQSRNPITGKLNLDEMGRSQNGVLRGLLQQMDDLNPAYGQARAAYAGPAAEREALYQGRAAVTENPDLVAIQAGRQTPERLQMMQLGSRDRLMQGAEALSNSTNPYRVLNTPAMEKRLAALYPENGPDVARLLMQRDLEGKMAATSNSLVGNSATAERQLADQAFADEGLLRPIIEGAAETAITGAPVMTLLRSGVGNRVADTLKLGAGRRAVQKAEEIAPLALDTNTQAAISRLLSLQAQRQEHDAVLEALMKTAGTRGGHVGAGTGSTVAAELMRD